MQVRDKGVWLASHKDACKHGKPGIVPSMFPSGQAHVDTSDSDQKLTDEVVEPSDVLVSEISSLPLERCMRIVPHDQNTGAFFVAVLQKLSPLPGDLKIYSIDLELWLQVVISTHFTHNRMCFNSYGSSNQRNEKRVNWVESLPKFFFCS